MFINFYRAVKKKLKERMDDFQVLCSSNRNACLANYVIILLFCDIKIIPVTYDDLKIQMYNNCFNISFIIGRFNIFLG
jgi:hypothetical protein